jgi:hypothetical protein
VAADKRSEIQRNCGQEEEGRRRALHCTTIWNYFLCTNSRAHHHSLDDAFSKEVHLPIAHDAPRSVSRTAINLLSSNSSATNCERDSTVGSSSGSNHEALPLPGCIGTRLLYLSNDEGDSKDSKDEPNPTLKKVQKNYDRSWKFQLEWRVKML